MRSASDGNWLCGLLLSAFWARRPLHCCCWSDPDRQRLTNCTISGAGNDKLDRGIGADVMAGGAGNDNYYVGNDGDIVSEAVGGADVGHRFAPPRQSRESRGASGRTGLP